MSNVSKCFSCAHKNDYDPKFGYYGCKLSGQECKGYSMFEPKVKPKPITNYDLLRAMSVEEMALQVAEWNHGDCPPFEFCPKHRNEVTHYLECTPWKCWLDWLKQEADK